MYLVRNLQSDYRNNPDLTRLCARQLNLETERIIRLKLLRRSLDARRRDHLKYNYTVLVDLKEPVNRHPDLFPYEDPRPYLHEELEFSDPNPFIIGCGPAGLFCAMALLEKGFKPWLFDRGEQLEKRAVKVERFWRKGELDPDSNAQFGEGGAGTFSDGKLTSRNRDYYTEKIFELLVKMGADPKIKTEALPHLGSDGIRKLILNIRKILEKAGCRFFWQHRLQDIQIREKKVVEVRINKQVYRPETLILAPGNSARDTFSMLAGKIQMISKPFSVGFRIEHPQDYLNSNFYGKRTDISITGPATYRLTAKSGGRGIYSFCMCPGGEVISSSTESGHLVTNGMSWSSRKGRFGNSAIVCTVDDRDYGKGILDGINLQRRIESACFNQDKGYFAPVQNPLDFINGGISRQVRKTTYLPGIYKADLNSYFPAAVTSALKAGLSIFGKRSAGFLKKGMLIAPETRTSSPVRILREPDHLNSPSACNLFPIGEGSGYAGGIISSAADGYKLGTILKLK